MSNSNHARVIRIKRTHVEFEHARGIRIDRTSVEFTVHVVVEIDKPVHDRDPQKNSRDRGPDRTTLTRRPRPS